MLEILIPTIWVCFSLYAAWYFTSAKHYSSMTPKEATLLWKIHKRSSRCNARKWREIKRRNTLIGIECECGYKHTQKRPIVTNQPVPNIQPQTAVLARIHTPYGAE